MDDIYFSDNRLVNIADTKWCFNLSYKTANWAAETAIQWIDYSSEFVSFNEADL